MHYSRHKDVSAADPIEYEVISQGKASQARPKFGPGSADPGVLAQLFEGLVDAGQEIVGNLDAPTFFNEILPYLRQIALSA